MSYLTKWLSLFPKIIGNQTRADDGIDNSLEYNSDGFPQRMSNDPVRYDLENAMGSQLFSNDERLKEKIEQSNTVLDNHKKDAAAHTNGIAGNAGSATVLKVARKIGGVSFDGSADIDLPGVNKKGNQDTTGNADTATKATGDKNGLDITTYLNKSGGTMTGDLINSGYLGISKNIAKVTSVSNNNTVLAWNQSGGHGELDIIPGTLGAKGKLVSFFNIDSSGTITEKSYIDGNGGFSGNAATATNAAQLGGVGADRTLQFRGMLPAGVNWHTIVTPGMYTAYKDSTQTHSPVTDCGAYEWGTLQVFGDAYRVMQLYKPNSNDTNSGLMYINNTWGYDSANPDKNWNGWQVIASTDYVSNNYLKLSGGTVTGHTDFKVDATFEGLVDLTNSCNVSYGGGDTGDPVADQKANIKIGSWYGVGFYDTCGTNGYTVGINTRTGQIKSKGDIVSGGHFIGALTGNADTSTKATGDKNGLDITTYLNKTGGTMTGNLVFASIGDVAKSNVIAFNGSTDGASIYYQTTAADQGNLVLNIVDDSNVAIQFAANGTFKSSIDASGVFNGNVNGNAATATKATGDKNGLDITTYLNKSGGTMTGALNLANGTSNLAGDDAYFGDMNIAGHFCVKGANDATGLALVNKDGSDYGELRYYSNALHINKDLYIEGGYSVGTSGYSRLTNGMIMQWGIAINITSETFFTITYPIALSCVAYADASVDAITRDSSSNDVGNLVRNVGTSSMAVSVAAYGQSVSYPYNARWLVIGAV